MAIQITPELLHSIALPYRSNLQKRDAQNANIQALAPAMNCWFPTYHITTKLRVAHFLAQSCAETADFTAMTEYPARGGKEYEPDTRAGQRVGNHFPGDGPKYIGRGLLHLTGRDNYLKLSQKFEENLIDYPERVASEYSLAVRTACEFWDSKGLNSYADLDDFDTITYRVNGGHNGKEQREQALRRIKKILHI
ncbi:glycoside hydrolase family 19 protein [Pantoea cypripedii]|uniref:Glycoside hydrolase n=1 Tax=Pantoea cypripedii TaxID=55209 RepID=A0A1X1EZS6_PANCY|nr:glycoside hydrolase family 19 protein [Pantoea cypripedii]MBP2195712.1 putative chitinase [Pantoea cypripedii]ORM95539.1 glycoside hydrolase [Pantoea cypripedii]